jgi:hypothetical protein
MLCPTLHYSIDCVLLLRANAQMLALLSLLHVLLLITVTHTTLRLQLSHPRHHQLSLGSTTYTQHYPQHQHPQQPVLLQATRHQ